MTLWYQNAVINGVTMPAQRKHDTSQRRWRDLVQPLIPSNGEGRLFLELGCNAGFYLRKASELGYNTWGIEKEKVYYEQAQYWELQEPRGVRIEFADINDYQIPACFICLIANVHYWLTPPQINRLMQQLKEKALNVILVSRIYPDERHLSDCTEKAAREIFSDWEFVDWKHNSKHYSILFHNPNLIEYDTANLFNIQPFTRSRRFLPAFREFIDVVISRRKFRLDKTAYWNYATWRGWRNRLSNLRRIRKMILLAERDGITNPPLVRANGLMIDGNHRLIIAEKLGIPRIICKQSST